MTAIKNSVRYLLEVKTCTKCGAERQLDGFFRNVRCKDGRLSQCKDCVSAAEKVRRSVRLAARESGVTVHAKRTCSKCQTEKAATEFNKDRSKPSGMHSHCRSCQRDSRREYMREYQRRPAHVLKQRNRHLQKKYQLSPAQFESMLAAQHYRCALCRTDKPGGQGVFHVDHDHKTGKVRGLLCSNCNRGIGHLKEDPFTVMAAVAYLGRVA